MVEENIAIKRKKPMFRFPPLATAVMLTLTPAFAETPVATDMLTKVEARERLAACATEWRHMKMSGTEGALIWREFSKMCMARAAQAKSAISTLQNENASPPR